MALDPLTQDPCSLLNSASYPTLWISAKEDDSSAYAKIASVGVPKTFLSSLPTNLTADILSSSQPTSSFRLVQFLSGGGVAAADTTKHFNQPSDTLLKGTTYEGIVDTYIIGSAKGLNKSAYTYSTDANVILTDSNIWVTDDDISQAPVSLIGKLIKSKYVLSESQIYTKSQFDEGATSPTSGTESLLYLYKQEQGTVGLTPAQTALKNTLEATNLRFFGAYLSEYCFYRTRYEWLLSKYFTIYAMPNDTSISNALSHPYILTSLFSGAGSGETQSAIANQPTQAELLKALAYQMACLNTRMTDMRRILSSINTYYNGVFTDIQTNLNDKNLVGSNSELTATIKSLQASANDANGYLSQTEFTKSVMEYNSEKNRYSNIMLGLYSFLNIAVLATVFQLARGS